MTLTVIGGIIGVILNILLSNKVMSLLLRNIGITKYDTIYSVGAIVIPIVFVGIAFFVVSYLVSRKIKKVETRELIVE